MDEIKSFLRRHLCHIWGVITTLLAIILGIPSTNPFVESTNPDIIYDIISETKVFSFEKPLDKLKIFYDGNDIKLDNLDFSIITVEVSNIGDVNVKEVDFEKNLLWGLKVENGSIVNEVRIISVSSEYVGEHLNPKIIGKDSVSFNKIYFDKDEFVILELIVLHQRNIKPEILSFGKISGIKEIPVKNSWEKKLEGRPRRSIPLI
jgi:hypothetical protein